jgi:Protein of unknown function (DUF1353)
MKASKNERPRGLGTTAKLVVTAKISSLEPAWAALVQVSLARVRLPGRQDRIIRGNNMSEFTKPLVVTPLSDGRTWVLMEPFSYDIGSEGSANTVNVPVLFMTDFASVPRPFWSVFPPWGRYGNAAVIHDFLYADQSRPRAEADHIFLQAMTVLKVGRVTRYILFFSVRWFGWLAWRSDRRRKLRGVSHIAVRMPDKCTEGPAEVLVARPPSMSREGSR